MKLVKILFLTMIAMECLISLSFTISYTEWKSWIRHPQHLKRGSRLGWKWPDCLSQDEGDSRGKGCQSYARIVDDKNFSSDRKNIISVKGKDRSRSSVNGKGQGRRIRSAKRSLCILEQEERQRIARLTKENNNSYIPNCNEDGSYSAVQCHPATRSCWCVTVYGKLIPGSSVLPSQDNRLSFPDPHCSRFQRRPLPTVRRRSSRMRKRKKRKRNRRRRKYVCNRSDRSIFNKNLMTTFRSEYERYQNYLRRAGRIKDDGEMTDEKVLRWKFKQLDKNVDLILRKNETRTLKRLVKQQIKPKNCSRNFLRVCAQRDRKITLEEWISCFHSAAIDQLPFETFNSLVDSGHSTTLHPSQLPAPVTSLNLNIRPMEGKEERAEELPDCLKERQTALESAISNDQAGVIPKCTEEGLYEKIQCAQSYCWCVEPFSGKKIPNSLVANSKPDCSLKPMKGCLGAKKIKFVKKFLEMIHNKTRIHGGAIRILHSRGSTDEEALKAYFKYLDVNSNQRLDRREWKVLKQETSGDKLLKKCGRRLGRHCDSNENKRISLTEWMNCLKVENTAGPVPRPPSHRPEAAIGKNPLIRYLS